MAKPASEDLRVVLLDEGHDRGSFTCGVESLDRYLKTQASQDVCRKANAVFILSNLGEPARILGYYTLCAMAISQGDVPEAARKHIPRHPLVSATLIGRLAVAMDRQGQRLGAVLLADALQRRSTAPARLDPRWSWSMRSTRRRPASTRRMGSSVCPTRSGSCCRCVLRAGGRNSELRIRFATSAAIAEGSEKLRWPAYAGFRFVSIDSRIVSPPVPYDRLRLDVPIVTAAYPALS